MYTYKIMHTGHIVITKEENGEKKTAILAGSQANTLHERLNNCQTDGDEQLILSEYEEILESV